MKIHPAWAYELNNSVGWLNLWLKSITKCNRINYQTQGIHQKYISNIFLLD